MLNAWFRRLRHNWFNTAPCPDWEFITDKYGQKYWFRWRDDSIPILMLWHRGKPIGNVNLLWEPPNCELADIVITKPEFRGRGLGFALMREIIARARAKGMQAIVGTIIPGDGGESLEYLRDWYQRQGFRVDGDQLYYDLTER